jgi:hypothetical protein
MPAIPPFMLKKFQHAHVAALREATEATTAGLGLDWSEHGGLLDRIGAAGDRCVRKFKPVALRQIHTAGNKQAHRQHKHVALAC